MINMSYKISEKINLGNIELIVKRSNKYNGGTIEVIVNGKYSGTMFGSENTFEGDLYAILRSNLNGKQRKHNLHV